MFTVFLTVRTTMAIDLASRSEVDSSMNITDGLATTSTTIINLFFCSMERPFTPGRPTRKSLNLSSSINQLHHLLRFWFHVGRKMQPRGINEGFVDSDAWRVDATLFAVSSDPREDRLILGIPGDGDASVDVPSNLSRIPWAWACKMNFTRHLLRLYTFWEQRGKPCIVAFRRERIHQRLTVSSSKDYFPQSLFPK